MTIHRLLGWRGDFFEHHADHPISGRLLIVDEASMMDMWLAYQLVRTVPEGMKVIFDGDADQLPSVGPGQVLHHMIESGNIRMRFCGTFFAKRKDRLSCRWHTR